MGALVLDPVPVGPGQVRSSTGPPPLKTLDPLILLLGDNKSVTQQQPFSVKAYVYSSRSTSIQSSVDIPPLKGMGSKPLTVERAKTSKGR